MRQCVEFYFYIFCFVLNLYIEGISFWEVLQRFNANVSYSGLIHSVTQDVSYRFSLLLHIDVFDKSS